MGTQQIQFLQQDKKYILDETKNDKQQIFLKIPSLRFFKSSS